MFHWQVSRGIWGEFHGTYPICVSLHGVLMFAGVDITTTESCQPDCQWQSCWHPGHTRIADTPPCQRICLFRPVIVSRNQIAPLSFPMASVLPSEAYAIADTLAVYLRVCVFCPLVACHDRMSPGPLAHECAAICRIQDRIDPSSMP